jgi:hypothetical protein
MPDSPPPNDLWKVMRDLADKTIDAQQRFWDQVTRPAAPSSKAGASKANATDQAQQAVTDYVRSMTKLGLQFGAHVWQRNLNLGSALWGAWTGKEPAASEPSGDDAAGARKSRGGK